MPIHHRKTAMRSRLAVLLASLTVPAFAGPPTWNPIQPPVQVYIQQQQQPDYAKSVGDGISDFGRAIEALGHRRQRAAAAPVEPVAASIPVAMPVAVTPAIRAPYVTPMTLEQAPDGRWMFCRGYGENKFCT